MHGLTGWPLTQIHNLGEKDHMESVSVLFFFFFEPGQQNEGMVLSGL